MRTSGETGQVTAGTAGVSPAMSAKRENEASCKELRACGAFAGETPAVPAKSLDQFHTAYAPFRVCQESGYHSRFTNGLKLLSVRPA